MFTELLRLAAGKPVFTADYYILDPVSGKVLAFVDWNDPTHLVVQTDSTKQVRPPQPSALFAGRLAVQPTAAGTFYISNRVINTWRYLHDGTGCSMLHVFARTGSPTGVQVLSATARNNAAVTGHNIYTSGDTVPRILTRNGATTVIIGGALAAGTAGSYISYDYQTAAVECAIHLKSARYAKTEDSAPAAGDPDRALVLLNGETSSGSDFWWQGQWAATAATRLWSASTRARWQEYIRAAYGIAP